MAPSAFDAPANPGIALGIPTHDTDKERRQQALSLELFQKYGLPVYREDLLNELANAVKAHVH